MSDSHDHPHPHDHSHPQPPAAGPAPAGSPPAQAPIEDAGSQALAEALKSSFAIVKVIMVILVILFLASGVFTVPPQNKAVVLRLGKPVGSDDSRLLDPGLHWSFPYPIDEVVMIPVGEIQTVHSTAGWYNVTPEQEASGNEPPPAPALNPALDGYTLTADGNILHVRASLRYRITQPLNYAFYFAEASELVTNILDNALFRASTEFQIDRVLYSEKTSFAERVTRHVADAVAAYRLGITVDPVNIEVKAPRQLKAAFDEVLVAEQNSSRVLTEARTYYTTNLSAAISQSNSIVSVALAEKTSLVSSLEADAAVLKGREAQYLSNPALFRDRVITEAMQRVLTNAEDKFVLSENPDGKREMRVLLNREKVKKTKKPQP